MAEAAKKKAPVSKTLRGPALKRASKAPMPRKPARGPNPTGIARAASRAAGRTAAATTASANRQYMK